MGDARRTIYDLSRRAKISGVKADAMRQARMVMQSREAGHDSTARWQRAGLAATILAEAAAEVTRLENGAPR